MLKSVFPALVAILALAFVASVSGSARAATLSGIVATPEGRLVLGAMVTLFDENENRATTVYTDKNGRFSLTPNYAGPMKLRVRAPYFTDYERRIEIARLDDLQVKMVIRPEKAKEKLSDSLTASAHATRLKWSDETRRGTFISQCHYCHQIGNELTRQPRDEEEWREIIGRMEGYFTVITPWDKREFATVLARDFDGKPVEAVQTHSFHPGLGRARLEEWRLGDGFSFIHDTEVGSDGKLYGVDQGHDVVWELDRATGEVTSHAFPDIDLPEGGLYAGAQLPIGIFTGKHGPHSLVEDEDGKFWITGSLSSMLLSFDIRTKKFEMYPIGGDALYPHTIRRDREGLIWFTLPGSNQVGRFDPKSKKMTLIQLPHNGFARWLTDFMFPYVLKFASLFPKQNTHMWISHHWWTGLGKQILNFPYGIDVHPETGEIWYSKLYADKIGRIDPKTLEVREYDTPMTGPRRLRIAKDGILWIPSFDEGGLMRFDPKSESFASYKLPKLAANEYEVPYALNIHPETQRIWITTNQSDRLLRFDPKDESFVSYPSPTRVSFVRDLVFTEDNKICASNSNLPAHAIEGGRPVMFCLDPEAFDARTE